MKTYHIIYHFLRETHAKNPHIYFRIPLLTVFLLIAGSVYSQRTVDVSKQNNYIITVTPQDATSTATITGGNINVPANVRTSVQVQYIDGLGRPLQEIDVAASPLGKDMVIPHEYTLTGQEANQYLPYISATGNGKFQDNAIAAQKNYHTTTSPAIDAKPWSESQFEASPLNRPIVQYGPGQAWTDAGKSVRTSYKSNAALEVKKWIVSGGGATAVYYYAGSLFLKETLDEDKRLVKEYTDLQGRTIRQEQILDNNTPVITQYVYDDYGNQVYVIPPKASGISSFTHTSTDFTRYIYAYVYDHRNRVVRKHIPGAGWSSIVYDKADRPILVQDTVQRGNNQWSFTKYDLYGRVVMTGVLTSTNTRKQWETNANTSLWEERSTATGTGYIEGYTNRCQPVVAANDILQVNYYDQYDFPSGFSSGAPSRQTTPPTGVTTRGLLTGSKVKVLDTNTWLATIHYYDAKSRLQEVISKNIQDKWDRTVNEYDFTGRITATTHTHQGNDTSSPTLTIRSEQQFDHAGRPTHTWYKLNGETTGILVAQNSYNELGQLIQTDLHNSTLESTTYQYNIRSWLKSIDGGYFKQRLHYNDSVAGLTIRRQWSGNISAAEWQAPTVNNDWHAYSFSYDRLSRLTEGSYKKSATQGSGYGTTGAGLYNEDYTYDMMGNITTLNRWHPRNNVKTQVDKLTFTLAGNQLVGTGDAISFPPSNPLAQTTVTLNTPATAGEQKNCEGFVLNPGFSFTGGTGSSLSLEVDKALCSSEESGYEGNGMYTYDASGRLIKDTNKNIDIQYNHLSLVKEVSQGTKKLRYTYDASGRRLQRTLPDNTLRTYIDGIEYKGNTIDFITTPYGRIRKETGGWTYDYFLKDHLGNIRVVLASGTSTQQIYMATMEESRAEEETQYFENLETTRADRPYNYPDKAPLNTKLAKVPGKSEGPKLTLKVMAGDTINISAQAFYNIDKTLPGQGVDIIPVLGNAMAAMATGGITPLGEAAQLAADLGATASTSVALAQVPPTDTEDESPEPKSGLNFVAYNENFEVLEANTGVLLVDDQINTIQNLSTDKIVIQESGYLEVFVNNEAQTPVFFDNLMVTVSAGNVLEVNAYYPYGKQIVGLSSASINTPNYYKYNGKELQDFKDMKLGWLDYGARMGDPGPGRFWVPDPMAMFTPGISPYSIASCNPIRYIDEYGLGPREWWISIKDFFASTLFGLRPKGVTLDNGFSNREYQSNRGKSTNTDFKHVDSAPPRPYDQLKTVSTKIDIPNVDINVDVPEISIPIAQSPSIPPIIFLDIKFYGGTSKFIDKKEAEEEMMKLVKTLQDYPLIKIYIEGNTGSEKGDNELDGKNRKNMLQTRTEVDGRIKTVEDLMNARASAIMRYLYRMGISDNRMIVRPGRHFKNDVNGRKTTVRRRE